MEKIFKHKGASTKLVIFGDGTGRLVNLMSKDRGRGHASEVLTQAVGYADRYELTLYLIAQAYGDPKKGYFTNTQLMNLYGRFGFERLGTGHPLRMRREPRRKNVAYDETQTNQGV